MRIFIGYDSREDIAYQVCRHSILKYYPDAEIIPLRQNILRSTGWYSREIDPLSSTEFTFTRFLIPELCEFKGWALFMDCDMLLTTDIRELFDLCDDQYAVMCVQHDYKVKEGHKMDGQRQFAYPRKNWSSVMLINCEHPSNRKLTKELVNDIQTTGSFLHRFGWLDDNEIGNLDHTWNYLVGVYNDINMPNLIHYTDGGPYFKDYFNCEFHQYWKNSYTEMTKNTWTEEDVLDR